MTEDITTLVQVDFRDFKFSNIRRGLFNEIYMTREQYDLLSSFLAESRPDIEKLITSRPEPDQGDMEMMGVKREEVGYRTVTISLFLDEKSKLPKDWTYTLAYVTKGRDGNPGMALPEEHYTREQVREL